MGDSYIYTKNIIILLMINLFILLTRGTTDIFKSNSGFFEDIHLPIIESLINLIVSIILAIYLDVIGVIIGTVLSNILLIYLWSPILIFKRCFDRKAIDYLKKLFNNFIIIFINIVLYLTFF